MALGTDFQAQILLGAPGHKALAAGADHGDILIIGVNLGFHGSLRVSGHFRLPAGFPATPPGSWIFLPTRSTLGGSSLTRPRSLRSWSPGTPHCSWSYRSCR